ncbi:MAG TPA: MFS transporter [Candidatus Baltobacteraceae bacterium]|nr:MFS transporter [Candidatus Baltobacteraceae bacterium]
MSIFASRAFRLFYLGQALSVVGDGLRILAVPLLVYKLTGSALSTGVSYVCEIAPFSVFGLIGGSLADRLDRRTLMIVTDGIRCAVMTTFAVLFAMHALTIGVLYGGLVLISMCAAVFMGGQSSSLPFLLGKERGTQAVAALGALENTSNLVTPAIGGAMFSVFGPLPALAINAFTYLWSQLALARIPTLGPETVSGMPSVLHIREDIRSGFRLVFSDRGMRAQAFASGMLNLIGFGGFAIVIPFLKKTFGATDPQVGLFFSISAIGALGGSLVAGKLAGRWPFGRMLCVALLLDAVLFLPVIYTHNIWIAGTFWALGNGCANFEIAQIIGFRLRVTPEDYVGRVFGVVRLIVLAGMAPGILGFGYLADRFSPHTAMTVSAYCYLAVAFAAIASPAVRNESR